MSYTYLHSPGIPRPNHSRTKGRRASNHHPRGPTGPNHPSGGSRSPPCCCRVELVLPARFSRPSNNVGWGWESIVYPNRFGRGGSPQIQHPTPVPTPQCRPPRSLTNPLSPWLSRCAAAALTSVAGTRRSTTPLARKTSRDLLLAPGSPVARLSVLYCFLPPHLPPLQSTACAAARHECVSRQMW